MGAILETAERVISTMKPNWKPIKIRLGQIQAWENNPRMSNKAQAQRIIASEKKFGQPVPFLVAPEQDGRYLLYDGHQRLAAWFTVYGADYVMDAMVSDRPLTTDEHKELVITLHTGATGSWNWEVLSGWSAGELQAWGMDADTKKQWDNDSNNLKELLNAEQSEPVDAEPQIDRAAELQEKWSTASGQLWKLGEHRLLIGDCTVRENVERLMGGEKAGACVTDPPYGLGDKKSFNDNHADYEDETPFELSLLDLSMPFVVWGGNYYEPLPEARNKIGWIVWDKRPNLEGEKRERADRIFGQHFEIAITNIGALRGKMLRHTWGGFYGSEEILHKTQKPLKLFEDCIKETDGIVVEYFAGSGTTIIAAHNLNRRCFAMEISPNYGAVILERFAAATGIQPELQH